MAHYTFSMPSEPRRLLSELLVAIPALSPTTRGGRVYASFSLMTTLDRVDLYVPDEVTREQIEAVLATHDSTPIPPDPTPDYGTDATLTASDVVDAVTSLRAYLALSTPTNAQTIAAFKLLIRCVLFLARWVLPKET